MTAVSSLNLTDAFGYSLVLTFVTGTVLRARNYRAMVGLVYNSANRWPKLRALVATHRAIFLRWPRAPPPAVPRVLTLANASAARFVWPPARVAPGALWAPPAALAVAA